MLEHTPQLDTSSLVRPISSDLTPSALSAAREAQVRACLDHLCARADADHPHRSAADLRLELELRLAEMTAAHRELGSDIDTATVAALQQLRREFTAQTGIVPLKKRTGLFHRRPWLRPALLPLSLFSLFYVADATGFAWRTWAHLLGIAIDGDGTIIGACDAAAIDAPFYRFELFIVPLLVGLITGLVLRKGAGRAVLNSLTLLAVVAILLPGFLSGLGITGIVQSVPAWVQLPSFVPGATGASYWIALGYSGAQLGSWVSQRRAPRR